MTIENKLNIKSTEPVLKTLIYLPDLHDFSRKTMDTRYRGEVNGCLARLNKNTLPVNHLHLVLDLSEGDLFEETLKAVSSFDGYLVLELSDNSPVNWLIKDRERSQRGLYASPMQNILHLSKNIQSLRAMLYDPNFKPHHIVLVGDWMAEGVTFLNDIMLVELIPTLHSMRERAIPVVEDKPED